MNTKTKLLSALIATGIITAATLTYAARPWYPCSEKNDIPAEDCGTCDDRHMETKGGVKYCVKNKPYCLTHKCTLLKDAAGNIMEPDWTTAVSSCPNGLVTLEDLGCSISDGTCSDLAAIGEMLEGGNWTWTADSCTPTDDDSCVPDPSGSFAFHIVTYPDQAVYYISKDYGGEYTGTSALCK